MTTFLGIPSPGMPLDRGAVGPVSTPWYAFFENMSHGLGSVSITVNNLGGGAFISATPITNSLAADVLLNNIASYFDGPTVAQGTAGTWFASGTVTVLDTVGAAAFDVKLWDGTTVIASAEHMGDSNRYHSISLSGFIASPVGNIRISVKDLTSVNGGIMANITGNGKDSTLTAFRIA